MFKLIEADLHRYGGKPNFKSLCKFWRIPGLKYIVCWRLSNHYSKLHPIGFIARLLYKKYFVKYGFQIPRETKLGEGFQINHFGGIVINKGSVIGKNCTISQNITIGHTKRGIKAGCPTLGDLVYIGPGAVILGGIRIGTNVLIAANSLVTTDIDSNSIVSGNPAVIKPRNDATEGYINNIFNEP